MSAIVSDLCTDALRELGVLNAADPPSGEDADLALGRLNLLLDNMQAESKDVYAPVLANLSLPVAWSDTLILPAGYQAFLMFTLAEDLASPMRVALSPKTERKAALARHRVFGTTAEPQTIRTRDDGVPGSRGLAWDYRTGGF